MDVQGSRGPRVDGEDDDDDDDDGDGGGGLFQTKTLHGAVKCLWLATCSLGA